ncbi:protein YoaL [Citrobacter youngae]|uniref:protein YoaL n=1 Tax=Citrobacter youngae TaxID=133448 RepID=UPI003CD04641
MDRHRRHFTIRPLCAFQIGTFCHKFSLHNALTPETLSAQFGHSLSRSLSWNY